MLIREHVDAIRRCWKAAIPACTYYATRRCTANITNIPLVNASALQDDLVAGERFLEARNMSEKRIMGQYWEPAFLVAWMTV